MIAVTHTPFATHVMRIALSLVLSVAGLGVLLLALRASSALQSFSWYVIPLSVAVGFAPIVRWYGRDAFPIGVLYCPAMFFLLRYLAQVLMSEPAR